MCVDFDVCATSLFNYAGGLSCAGMWVGVSRCLQADLCTVNKGCAKGLLGSSVDPVSLPGLLGRKAEGAGLGVWQQRQIHQLQHSAFPPSAMSQWESNILGEAGIVVTFSPDRDSWLSPSPPSFMENLWRLTRSTDTWLQSLMTCWGYVNKTQSETIPPEKIKVLWRATVTFWPDCTTPSLKM